MPNGEKPRSEPEIIPPDRAGRSTRRSRISFDTRGAERVYVARLGPLGFILAMLLTAIMFAVLLALLLGALLFLTPLVIFFVAGAIIAGFLRVYFRRAP